MTPVLRHVMLVDDERPVREGLRFLLQSKGFEVSDFESGSDFLQWWDAQTMPPRGVIVLDVRMEGISGLQVHDALVTRGAWLPVIFLSGHGDISMAVETIKRGAFDFLEKPANDHKLIERLESAFSVEARSFAVQSARAAFMSRWALLTPRERSLLPLVAAGRLNKQIAVELNVSVRTVEVFRARVFEKMAVRSAAELATEIEKFGIKS